MDRKTLLLLAGAATGLIIILLVSFSGGLSEQTLAKLKAEQSNYDQDVKTFNGLKSAIQSYVDQDKQLFVKRAPVWTQMLADLETNIPAGKTSLEEAAKLAKLNDDKKRLEIEQKIGQARVIRIELTARAYEIRNEAKKLLDLKKNFGKYVASAKYGYEAVKHSVDEQTLKSRVDRASTDWPKKASDLKARWGKLGSIREESKSLNSQVQVEAERTEKDYAAVLVATTKIGTNRNAYIAIKTDLKSKIDQLYRSWEKILADMEIRDGPDVQFYHKYKTITITVTDPEKRQSDVQPTEEVIKVPKVVYELHKNNLGMAIEAKPAGKYDEEANRTTPQPAGYSNIAPPGQSNQYGHWRTDHSGNSFWAFYGQYSFMRSMFWGPSYSPIYVNHYRDYRTSYNSGRSYYGRSSTTGRSRYGTSGTATASKYRSSKYVKSGGYKNSNYVKSGGSYRGSRHATPRSRSTGRSSRGGGRGGK